MNILLTSLSPDYPGGDASSIEDFNPQWISEFTRTNAYEVWERITDPLLFDIVEPRLVVGSILGERTPTQCRDLQTPMQ